MTTNQTERVSDEELDQMIWKLERDGMTPKMLSLMKELREVRRGRGDGRDQFEEWFKFHHGEEGSIVTLHRANGGANYADPHVDLAWIAWKDSRTAMLNHSGDTADMVEPVSNRDELNSPVTPDGWIPVSERMPEESGRYWCYVEEQNDLGKSHYQWNCSWNGDRWWVESENGGKVTMPLQKTPWSECYGSVTDKFGLSWNLNHDIKL